MVWRHRLSGALNPQLGRVAHGVWPHRMDRQKPLKRTSSSKQQQHSDFDRARRVGGMTFRRLHRPPPGRNGPHGGPVRVPRGRSTSWTPTGNWTRPERLEWRFWPVRGMDRNSKQTRGEMNLQRRKIREMRRASAWRDTGAQNRFFDLRDAIGGFSPTSTRWRRDGVAAPVCRRCTQHRSPARTKHIGSAKCVACRLKTPSAPARRTRREQDQFFHRPTQMEIAQFQLSWQPAPWGMHYIRRAIIMTQTTNAGSGRLAEVREVVSHRRLPARDDQKRRKKWILALASVEGTSG